LKMVLGTGSMDRKHGPPDRKHAGSGSGSETGSAVTLVTLLRVPPQTLRQNTLKRRWSFTTGEGFTPGVLDLVRAAQPPAGPVGVQPEFEPVGDQPETAPLVRGSPPGSWTSCGPHSHPPCQSEFSRRQSETSRRPVGAPEIGEDGESESESASSAQLRTSRSRSRRHGGRDQDRKGRTHDAQALRCGASCWLPMPPRASFFAR
jgi:hypothetical protein